MPVSVVDGLHTIMVVVFDLVFTVRVIALLLVRNPVPPSKAAVMVRLPDALGVYMTEQDAVAPEPESVQEVDEKTPVATLLVKFTLPEGILDPVVRVTVAVHTEE
jgi:hypothetical protein